MKQFYLSVITFFYSCTGTYAQQWQPVGDDDFNQASYFTAGSTSLALSPAGIPYVVYSDEPVGKYTTVKKFENGSWQDVGATGFSDSITEYTNIAIAPDGTPYVGYQDRSRTNKATVKKFDGTSWITVGSTGFSANASNYISLDIAPDGTPWIAYADYGSSGKATIKKFDGTSWITVGSTGFSAGTVSYVNLALATDGTAYIGYKDQGLQNKATVKRFDGNAWDDVGAAGLSAASADNISFALAADNTPYIGYQDGSHSNKATVKKFDGAAWVNIGTEGFTIAGVDYCSITIGTDGNPYIGFADAANTNRVTVKKWNGSAWTDAGGPGFSGYTLSQPTVRDITMAVAPDGSAYIAYQHYYASKFSDKAVVQKFDGTNWQPVGEHGIESIPGSYSTVASGPDGTAYFAFLDPGNGNRITVKKFNGNAWVNVGPPGFSDAVGTWPYMAISPEGVPYIVYEQFPQSAIIKKYDSVSAAWVTITNGLNAPGRVGRCRLAFAPDSSLYFISEYSTVVKKLVGSSWVDVGPVNPPTGINSYSSISFAPDGTPYIGLVSQLLTDQGFARNKASVKKFNGTAWEYVGDEYFNDSYSENFLNLCIAPDGTPYVAYQDELTTSSTYGPATVKKFDGTAWITVGLPRFTGIVDADLLKMVIAPNGTPYIAFGDPDLNNTTLTFGKKAAVMKFNGNAWVNAADDVSAGEAADVSFTLTKDGSKLLIAYNSGGSYVKSLLLAGVVPVKLINFSGAINTQRNVSLVWKVAEQLNITRYEIERNLDGNNYTTIGMVNANTQNEFTYQFTDKPAYTGTGFYRLKIIEQDGSLTYSKIVQVQLLQNNAVRLFPVPASTNLIISTSDTKYLETNATIIDNWGRTILKQPIKSNHQRIDIGNLAPGTYYVKLKDGPVLKFLKY